MADDVASSTPVVLLSGLPGALAAESAAACLRQGWELSPVGLTGPRALPAFEVPNGSAGVTISLVSSRDPPAQRAAVEEAMRKYGDRLVAVDCTHPSAVMANAELFAATGCPFVMGTTGGDREALLKLLGDSGVYALVAANMCKQVVALQAGIERMAADFPGAFAGYTMRIEESHQKTKADTSGTAKDMVESFQGLGLDISVEQIRMIREEEAQVAFGVPEGALQGHAYHTYSLQSADGSVEFQIRHNVVGRRSYSEGVADAVAFLARMKAEGNPKRIFNMIDVLEGGAMR